MRNDYLKKMSILGVFFFAALNGAEVIPSQKNTSQSEMERDQRFGTDLFAIPLDESELEDQRDLEEMNRIENKNTFPLRKGAPRLP